MEDKTEDKLPALENKVDWLKTIGILAVLLLINVVAFLVSYGFGVIITIPLTLFLGFLLLRDIVPRHRLPPGKSPHGIPT